MFENLSIPLPPLSEQQKIAGVLSAIQEAKEKTENVIKATKELKKSMMKHLFTYGPVLPAEDTGKVPLKETEIGIIPEHWEVVKLGEIAKQRKESIIPSGHEKSRYIGLEHIHTGEIKAKKHGFDNEVRSTKYKFYKGDILYGKLRPYLDKCVLVDFDGICSTDIVVIANSKKVKMNYLVNLMHRYELIKYATQSMTGVNHPRTSWKALSIFKIALPPLFEQQQIADILSAIDKKLKLKKAKNRHLIPFLRPCFHY